MCESPLLFQGSVSRHNAKKKTVEPLLPSDAHQHPLRSHQKPPKSSLQCALREQAALLPADLSQAKPKALWKCKWFFHIPRPRENEANLAFLPSESTADCWFFPASSQDIRWIIWPRILFGVQQMQWSHLLPSVLHLVSSATSTPFLFSRIFFSFLFFFWYLQYKQIFLN